MPVLIGVSVSEVGFAIYLHATQQKQQLLLSMNFIEANNKILAMQREKEMLSAETANGKSWKRQLVCIVLIHNRFF